MYRLFHVSDNPGIETFLPRPVPSTDAGVNGEAVWAVDHVHLVNYLVPRECPRVTYGVGDKTSIDDREKFFFATSAKRIIALESKWLEKIKSSELYLYELPTETFELVDAGAGYYISRGSVRPRSVIHIRDILGELLQQDVEVRFLPHLWDLRDAVGASSLEFSIIRFRNACPRPAYP